MPWSALIGGGASLLGGLFGDDAAGDAAAVQAKSAADAIAEQRRQYDLNRSDQAQFMNTGNAANKKLAQLLGLSGTPGGGAAASGVTREQLRAQLLPKYTTAATPDLYYGGEGREGDNNSRVFQSAGTPGGVDESGLNAAIEQQYQAQNPSTGIDSNAGDYGSLLKRFSTEDLNADPVYNSGLQFGLDQGTGAINARAIAGGGYDSGATLKALTKYANDYGSTKANESYNRYNTDQNNIYNKLAGVSGAGQQATNNVAASGTQIANNISGLTTDAGSARSAGIIGGANAWGGALGGVSNAANNYGTSNYLKSLMNGYGSKSFGSTGSYSGVDVPDYSNITGGY